MKTAIIYASMHHGNTLKIVEAIKDALSADTFDILKDSDIDISSYDCIGFASGVYFQQMHKSVLKMIEDTDFKSNQKVFLITTCGLDWFDYTRKAKRILQSKNIECLGGFECRGYDTWSFLKFIGGIAKGRPNAKDIENARNFINKHIKSE